MRIKTIADLVASDYNGEELDYNPKTRDAWVEDTLRMWCRNSAPARKLIERVGIQDAIVQYVAAWEQAHRDEYGLDDQESA